MEGFKSVQEELEYLRARVREKERLIGTEGQAAEKTRVARREVHEYAATPVTSVLHEAHAMPEYDILHHVLKLNPESHDAQIDGLIKLVAEKGIRNALSVAAHMKSPHLEDDLHRALVRYIAEGLPDVGGVSEKIRKELSMILFEVQPQAYADTGNADMHQYKLAQILASSEQLYTGLLSLTGTDNVFSLEIAVGQGTEEASLYIAIPSDKRDAAERFIASVFPHAHISEKRGDYNIFNETGEHAAAYISLAEHPALPLKTYDSFEHDPLNVVLAAFAKIAKHSEGAALQIVVGNEGERYNKHYKKMLRELEKGKSLKEAFGVPETVLGEIGQDLVHSIFSSSSNESEERREKPPLDQRSIESLTHKTKSRIVPCTMRVVASSPSSARSREILHTIESSLSQFDDPHRNRLKFQNVSSWGLAKFLHAFTFRDSDSSIAVPLSFSELTSIFHFTAERVTTSRELKKAYGKQAPAPVDMSEQGISVGINRYGAAETTVRFAPADRLRHMYVIGQTGTGKTGFLKHLIIQDIKNGEGISFIDPHGNDIEDILAAVPPERAGDVIYFDPAYTARPMGLNMLEYDRSRPEMKTFVVDEVYGIFRKLYSDVPEAFGPMFEQYYRNAVLLVLEDPDSGSTFVEIPRIFADPDFRALKLSRCNNPIIVQFWRKIAEQAQGDPSLENIAPYITSKFDVFLSNDIMRPIVGQEHSSFNFRDILDGKKIFLANLSKGRLGDRNSSLLGLVLVSKFLQAAFSRIDSRGELPPHYLYIDEFQNFATPSISTILSEARKYKLSLTVAHQFIAQLDEQIRDAVVGNVGTKVAFRVGTTDAEFLAKQFSPEFASNDLESLPNRHAVASLLVNGIPARPFTIETIDLPNLDHSRIDPLKQLSYTTYGRDRDAVESEIRRRFA